MSKDMNEPVFDEKGYDRRTFAPFCLQNCLNTEWNDVRLFFNDWSWFARRYGTDSIDSYYLNGYGVQGLVQAAMIADAIHVPEDRVHFNSEGDTCYIHFRDLDVAIQAAKTASSMIKDVEQIKRMIEIARTHGLED